MFTLQTSLFHRFNWLALVMISGVIALLGMATSVHAAARVTPGIAYLEAMERIDRECTRIDQNSRVVGLARFDCTSARSLRRSCRISRRSRPGERQYGICTGVLRYGLYAPGGPDSVWKWTPCYRPGHGEFGWASYRVRYTIKVYSTRRSVEAVLGSGRCKVRGVGNEF